VNEPRPCFKRSGTLEGDNLTVDHPEHANCAAVFGHALAPWENGSPLAFAGEALQQLAADLFALQWAAFPADGAGMNSALVHRVLAGICQRAEAAVVVLTRLEEAERAEAQP
jgi:hypothetical protein